MSRELTDRIDNLLEANVEKDRQIADLRVANANLRNALREFARGDSRDVAVFHHHEIDMDGKVFTLTIAGRPRNSCSFGLSVPMTILRHWSTEIPEVSYELLEQPTPTPQHIRDKVREITSGPNWPSSL